MSEDQTQGAHLHEALLNIVYEDADFVAIDKPAGLLVHRSPVDRRETRFAVQLLRDQLGYYVYPAHRLDKPTSGILLFAKSTQALAAVRQQFEEQGVRKQYLALVRGFAPATLRIEHPVKTRSDDYDTRLSEEPRLGITELQTLRHYELPVQIETFASTRYSLVKLSPLTGRRHQLRYHMKHISHPIVGDSSYGKGVHNRYFQRAFACERLLLMASELVFTHPYTEMSVAIRITPTGVFDYVLKVLGRDYVVKPA